MRFVIVNGKRTPRAESLCALCSHSIAESYLRDLGTRSSYCGHACYRRYCCLTAPAPQQRARVS
jgi:hypothetical protein